MLGEPQTLHLIDGLYEKLIEGGIGYFFPSAKFESLGRAPSSAQEPVALEVDHTAVTMNLLGVRCLLTRDEPFSHA